MKPVIDSARINDEIAELEKGRDGITAAEARRDAKLGVSAPAASRERPHIGMKA